MEKSCDNCKHCECELFDGYDNDILTCTNKKSGRTFVEETDVCDYYEQYDELKRVPLHEKKNFSLSDDISIDKLIDAGFKLGGWIKDVEGPKYYICKNLIGDIEIQLEISVKDNYYEFDDFKNIYVIDDNFCQPYIPFYTSDYGFAFLNDVIDKYNDFMDNLVNKNILIENKLERKLTK